MKQLLRKLFILMLICTTMSSGVFSFGKYHNEEHAKDLKKNGSFKVNSKLQKTKFVSKIDDYSLIYSDESIKLYSVNITCSGDNSVKLKIENLTNHPLKVNYKLWDASEGSKTIQLNAAQMLEGMCAPEYNNLLVEKIPAGSSTSNMNIVINYLQN